MMEYQAGYLASFPPLNIPTPGLSTTPRVILSQSCTETQEVFRILYLGLRLLQWEGEQQFPAALHQPQDRVRPGLERDRYEVPGQSCRPRIRTHERALDWRLLSGDRRTQLKYLHKISKSDHNSPGILKEIFSIFSIEKCSIFAIIPPKISKFAPLPLADRKILVSWCLDKYSDVTEVAQHFVMLIPSDCWLTRPASSLSWSRADTRAVLPTLDRNELS